MTQTDVVVVGSLNIDLVVSVPHLPTPGETIAGTHHLKTLGGKGANQAVAAARLGSSVAMVGRVGADPEGEMCVGGAEEAGVDTTFVVRDPDVPTGIAMIAVDPAGENSIVVGQGSNAHLTRADVERASDPLRDAAVVAVQLEIPMAAVLAAAELTRGTFVLNPAPAKPLPSELLTRVDVLVPNEVELSMLAGRAVEGRDDVIEAARSLDGPDVVIATLGRRGVIIIDANEALDIPAHEIDVVDTTAAGDAFCGALCNALARGEDLEAASRWACAAAGISATRMGAQPSLPTRAEVEALFG